VDSGGTWTVPGLEPGNYVIELRAGEDRWLRRELSLQRSEETIFLDIPAVRVHGSLTLGEEPLAAELVFGGETGAVRLRMRADEGGNFSGLLPEAGRWRVTVISEEPPVHRGLMVEVEAQGDEAWVDLELGEGVLAGKVVDAQGESVAGAVVTLQPLASSVFPVEEEADEEGKFRFEGIDTGNRVSVQAASGARLSEWHTVDLGQDPDAGVDLELVVRDEIPLQGQVLSAQGPIPGAYVLATVTNTLYSNNGFTDASGRFSLPLSQRLSEIGQVDLVILPPGFPLTAVRRSVEQGQPLSVTLDQRNAGDILLRDLQRLQQAPQGTQPVLVQDGIFLSVLVLARWNQMNGVAIDPQAQDWLMPMVGAGNYALCLVSVAQIEDPGQGGLPTNLPCTQGQLLPGGTLALSVPSWQKPSQP
jgi:hypothetical protein